MLKLSSYNRTHDLQYQKYTLYQKSLLTTALEEGSLIIETCYSPALYRGNFWVI
jgi:hypothetical protein